MASLPIRIVTVDEHPLVQEGLAATLSREIDMVVVGSAFRGHEAIEVVHRRSPDVVIVDLMLPDIAGGDLARRLLVESPRSRIVAIVTGRSYLPARYALRAGVHAVLSKTAQNRELVQAIRQVHAGRRVIPSTFAAQVAEHLTDEALTAREVQVLELVAWGNSNKEVAARLSIANDTVRMHMKSILAKLAAKDRTHAVTIALVRGALRLCEEP